MKKSALIVALAVFCMAASAKDTRDDHAGPSRPASMVKPGPDHEANTTYGRAAYITAFSQLRAAGPQGKNQPGVLGMMPSVGALDIDPETYRSAFDRPGSTIEPGYFSLRLKESGVNVEMTAIDHVAVYRLTFPESKESHVMVDVSHLLKMFRGGEVRLRDDKTIEGTATYTIGRDQDVDVYFSFQFSKPFRRRGVWTDETVSDNRNSARVDDGSSLGAFAYFRTHEGETILMKVGISSTDIADARKNLATEFPGWDFNQLCRESGQAWK